MARILHAVSLLVIGGAIGALLASGNADDPSSIVRQAATGDASASTASGFVSASAAGTVAAPKIEATQVVYVGTHQAMSARAVDVADVSLAKRAVLKPVRLVQAAGRMTDAQPPLPVMRPIPVRARDAEKAAASRQSPAEAKLVDSIQRELQRVGCYTGNLDGDWGPDTRRAMRAFNERVNASLPTDRPDYILLTLLQGHAAKACGVACPAGQELADGKCLPRAVIAEQRRRLLTEKPEGAQLPRAAVAVASGPSELELKRAEDERQRIADAEARRRAEAEDRAARVQAERAARAAALEKTRSAAEARRRAEIAALAARAARRAAAAARPVARAAVPVTTGALATAPPPLPARPSPAFRERLASRSDITVDRESAKPARHVATHREHHRRPKGARYVGQFMPPPTFRVGRLPAMRARGDRGYSYVSRPQRRRVNPQLIFRELQHTMP